LIFDVPVDLEADIGWSGDLGLDDDLTGEDYAKAITEEISRRQFAKNSKARIDASVVITMPLITIERGQSIQLEAVDWSTINSGAGIILDSETEEGEWILDGWRLSASRDSDGAITGIGTTEMKLQEP